MLMTENKQITIYDLLPLLKYGWVVFTRNGNWLLYRRKPEVQSYINFFGNMVEHWETENFIDGINLSEMLKIAPFDGDWKDSLMEVK